jgi:hypothetical protein
MEKKCGNTHTGGNPQYVGRLAMMLECFFQYLEYRLDCSSAVSTALADIGIEFP